jgi:ABC-type transport system substrate-binding protein
MAQQIQQDLAPLGITVRILEISGNAFEDAVCKRKESQACIYGWSQDYPDPSDFLDVLFNGKRITKENCNNTAFYNNEEVNKLLKEAREETRDPKKRLKMYQEIEKKILADAPWLPLYHSVDYRQCQPWLKGYQPHPVYWVRYEKLWIEQP